MFQYRQVLVRLRAGDTVREIARSGLMGRDKLGMLRAMAEQHGWLDVNADMPGDEAIAAVLGARAGPRELHHLQRRAASRSRQTLVRSRRARPRDPRRAQA